MPKENYVLIIGISGVTCGGKTTTASELHKILPNSTIISQDDYFLHVEDSRHRWIDELNHINFDILSSLDMEKMHSDIQNFIENKSVLKLLPQTKAEFHIVQNDIELRNNIYKKLKQSNITVLIIEGFCIYNYKPILDLFHLKYYFTLEFEECKKRRLTRVYEPPDCTGYFERCVWPEHLKQLEEVKENVEGIVYFTEFSNNPLDTILNDIVDKL